MSVFRHPHLTRGVVKTTKGAFVISRGLVNMPDEVGESLGWRRVDPDDETPVDVSRSPNDNAKLIPHISHPAEITGRDGHEWE